MISEPIISDELLCGYLEYGGYSSKEIRMFDRSTDKIYQLLSHGKVPRTKGQTAELVSIVGPPGSGKSTLMLKSFFTEDRKRHSVFVDPDDVRRLLPFFQNTVDKNKQRGLSVEEADQIAVKKWFAGTIYTTQSLLNRAQENDFNIVRTGTIYGPVTEDICTRAKMAGYELCTVVVLTHLSVGKASIAKRIKEGGHSVPTDYVEREYTKVRSALPKLLEHSNGLKIFWRDGLECSTDLAVEINRTGLAVVHNQRHAATISKSFGLSF